MVAAGPPGWPASPTELVEVQVDLARAAERAVAAEPWVPPGRTAGPPAIGACHVVFERGEVGAGRAGDRAWAAAVVWRPPAWATPSLPTPPTARAAGPSPQARGRRVDHHLRKRTGARSPRRSDDLVAQVWVAGRAPGAYVAGLLALREGPLLADAVGALDVRPDLLLVDATGLDHPRRAGLAVHLGAVVGLPTVGVTRRPLVAPAPAPGHERGATARLELDGRCVGYRVRTRSGVEPVVAHAAWRTTPETAAQVVLATSTPAARTPVALQEARRVAREARSLDAGA